MKGSARATELEYCLSQRAADITSDRHLQLFKTMGTAETGILNNVCSEELLYTFAKDLNGAKKRLHATTQMRMIRNTRLFYGLFRKITLMHFQKTSKTGRSYFNIHERSKKELPCSYTQMRMIRNTGQHQLLTPNAIVIYKISFLPVFPGFSKISGECMYK